MNYTGKTVGIWGYGVVGRSAATFLKSLGARIVLYDNDAQKVAQSGELTAPSLPAFFDTTDYIVPSPGIDTRAYRSAYSGIWLNELDLFATFFSKPVIAITGSLGKTTVTHLLSTLLKNQGIALQAAGNIGTPMLELIAQQNSLDLAVLELSSFQLEYSNHFAADLAIWTNFYENHLDRHTMQEYFDAKYKIIAHQSANHKAIVPWELKTRIEKNNPKSTLYYITQECPHTAVAENLYCYVAAERKFHNHQSNKAVSIDIFNKNTYLANWLSIWAACDIMEITCDSMPYTVALEHRLERVATIDGTTFINDSKSTTPASTLAALQQFPDRIIALILGGLDKGIDRTSLIQKLQNKKNITVYCFGAQAVELGALCAQFNVAHHICNQLADVMDSITVNNRYELVLFSPAGSSFDLFANYIDRGNRFKELVLKQLVKS